MKRTFILTLILALVVLAVPVAAQGNKSLIIGLSNKDYKNPEVIGELAFGMSTGFNLRGKYTPDRWYVGAGWREYMGDDHKGFFVGPFVLYANSAGQGLTDLGAEIGYRYAEGRFVLEGAGRLVVTTQEQSINLLAGIRF